MAVDKLKLHQNIHFYTLLMFIYNKGRVYYMCIYESEYIKDIKLKMSLYEYL